MEQLFVTEKWPAAIQHMKTQGRVDCCTLKYELGNAIFALQRGCGQNPTLILSHLRNTAPELGELTLVQRILLAGKLAKSDDFCNLVVAFSNEAKNTCQSDSFR